MQFFVVECLFGALKSVFAQFEMVRKRDLGNCEAVVGFVIFDTTLFPSLDLRRRGGISWNVDFISSYVQGNARQEHDITKASSPRFFFSGTFRSTGSLLIFAPNPPGLDALATVRFRFPSSAIFRFHSP